MSELAELITHIDPASKDPRRTIWELVDEHARRAKILHFHSTGVVGNHFHREMHEHFLLVSGEALKIALADVGTGKRLAVHNSGPGTLIEIPPGTAHAFICTPGSMLLGLVNMEFRESDLHEYKLLEAPKS